MSTTTGKKFWGGCIRKILKNLNSKKNFFCKNEIENFEKFNFRNFFFIKQYFSILNINLKWFQLSFDVYIVHIGQKLYIFKNFRPGSWKFCFVRWGYFGTLFWKKFESQYGFWSFHRRIIMPKILWVHFWWIWMKIVAIGPQ